MNMYRATMRPRVLLRAAASRQAMGFCQTVRSGASARGAEAEELAVPGDAALFAGEERDAAAADREGGDGHQGEREEERAIAPGADGVFEEPDGEAAGGAGGRGGVVGGSEQRGEREEGVEGGEPGDAVAAGGALAAAAEEVVDRERDGEIRDDGDVEREDGPLAGEAGHGQCDGDGADDGGGEGTHRKGTEDRADGHAAEVLREGEEG
jgi:hypothetical protein